eukprot:Opistho-1_new@55558
MRQLDVLVGNFDVARAVKARGVAVAQLDLAKAVVAQTVHEAVDERLRRARVHTEVAIRRIVLRLVNVLRVLSGGNADHPEELVDVIAGVTNVTAKDDEDVVDVKGAHNVVCGGLVAAHRLADHSNVRVVPRVVINEHCAVGHAGDLVTVVPPRHDARIVRRVRAQPVVGLAEVVEDSARPVGVVRSEHDGRRRVGVAGHPRRVHHKLGQQDDHQRRHADAHLRRHPRRIRLARLAPARRRTPRPTLRRRALRVVRGRGVGLMTQVRVQDARHGNGREDADAGREGEHEANHHAGKVRRSRGVEDDESTLVVHVLRAQPHAGGEGDEEKVEVEHKGRPRGRLVLGHGRDDGDVDLGVPSVPQRVVAARPRRNDARVRETDDSEEDKPGDGDHRQLEDGLERAALNVRAQVLDERIRLEECEDAHRGHVLARAHGLEPDERHLHRHDRPEHVERRVGEVEARRVPPHQQKHKRVQRDEIDDEHVAAPRSHHVKVRKRSQRAVEHRPALEGGNPQVVREHEREDRNALVVVRASDGARDVAGNYGNKGRGEESRARRAEL